MEKINTYSKDILLIFDRLMRKFNLEMEIKDEFSMLLGNSKVAIIIWVDRYERGVNFSFQNLKSGKSYASLDLFRLKGKPKISTKEESDTILKNMKWHMHFFQEYLEKELAGDFSDLENTI